PAAPVATAPAPAPVQENDPAPAPAPAAPVATAPAPAPVQENDPAPAPAPAAPVATALPAVTASPTGPATPTFKITSAPLEAPAPNALPPALAKKVHGLPNGYLLLASSYRIAKSAVPGKTSRTKRNMRLNTEVADALTRQMLTDKRLLGIRDLKASHYVDAALTYGRTADVATLIAQADAFRERWLGEDDPFEDPNHYTITVANNDWLDDMLDELTLAKANGLHGYMINVIIEAYLSELGAPSAT
ncbi:hypothetical protein AB0P03_36885, partial [Kitasatospora sp. NPDC088779]